MGLEKQEDGTGLMLMMLMDKMLVPQLEHSFSMFFLLWWSKLCADAQAARSLPKLSCRKTFSVIVAEFRSLVGVGERERKGEGGRDGFVQ